MNVANKILVLVLLAGAVGVALAIILGLTGVTHRDGVAAIEGFSLSAVAFAMVGIQLIRYRESEGIGRRPPPADEPFVVRLPRDLEEALREAVEHAGSAEAEAIAADALAGRPITDSQLDELIDFIGQQFIHRGLKDDDEPNALGLKLDDLIGKLYQASPRFWVPPEQP